MWIKSILITIILLVIIEVIDAWGLGGLRAIGIVLRAGRLGMRGRGGGMWGNPYGRMGGMGYNPWGNGGGMSSYYGQGWGR
ncbi:unnamed protein product, partial [Mesorhabditis belari]|uniref:Uncharacterized protein n=1 Tax=Mesorhabditis belari TaxID=2138241 RepID=A0AAF3F1P5_9BILA